MRFFVIVLVTLLLDQFSKYIITSSMLLGESIPVLPPVFYITYILNPGAAFGILAEKTTLFIVVSLLVVVGVLVGYRFLPRERILVRLASGLVAGGALGNLIDRVRLGRVIDFLDFRVWPVFNLADTAIVIGAVLLIIDIWRNDKGEQQRVDANAEN
ncbi:signal peptidase II [Desulfallas thermosapovorans]|uniref:Lipoprotein signal peptidase n=1 Tax=Desulfallas thermosapovorans DSM 6562 TaxID=1121431 RepID=A0A5S4ZYY4_9FIRM|nr:signal peptidase II [Desulfallas thermosapovorans]TYO97976.1 signal peptidase II Aspartic peptidase MEROPS family A08 [Desulfallas thermosapovorans DSM 6562]